MIIIQILQALILLPIMLLLILVASVLSGEFGGLFLSLFGIPQSIGYWIAVILTWALAIGIVYSACTSGEPRKESQSSAFPAVVAGFILGRLTK